MLRRLTLLLLTIALSGACYAAEPEPATITTDSGLKYQILKTSDGIIARTGHKVKVDYTGWLTDGTKFDSSLDREPFLFYLGDGQVIQGWDEGVTGMKVGEKRRLIIPAELAYGSRGSGRVIPPSATLIFEVELLDIELLDW